MHRLTENEVTGIWYLYEGFGQAFETSVTGDVFLFGGQWGYYTDTQTGFVLCTYRYFDPTTGRWLTRDPIGYDGGVNLYAYCKNNPIMGIDPTGEVIVGIAIAIALVGLKIFECQLRAKALFDEIIKMPHNHDNGGDKSVHCLTACILGTEDPYCGVLAANSSERIWPRGPLRKMPEDKKGKRFPYDQNGDFGDEKANWDGVYCAAPGNDLDECAKRCHENKGYHPFPGTDTGIPSYR